jgi:hypothetical protein
MRGLLLALLTLAAPLVHADPRVDLLSPDSLSLLDQPGEYSFATALGLGDAEKEFLSTHALTGLKRMRLDAVNALSPNYYRPIQKLIRADIDEIIAQSGETVAYSAENAKELGRLKDKKDKDGKVPRQFDYFWLTSRDAAFPLVAVVNRIDKRDFYSSSCGEVRFIYRIAYYRKEDSIESKSTMPLFLNVVYEYVLGTDGTCTEIARLWNSDDVTKPASATSLAEALRIGPLAKSRMKLKQIELNMQAMRYPSELKYDFGGQAIYLMRIFQDKLGTMTPIPLENTLDVAVLQNKKNATLKQALIDQISAGLDKIDNGTFVLNNTGGNLLATRAISFTTTGRARLSNKPFSAVFGANGEGLASIKLDGTKFVKSTLGLVERLNNSTCMGCHQTGGTAGFHLLGRAGSLNTAFNQVILPFSPHYLAERTRRSGYIQALSEGREGSTFRPPSFYPVASGAGSDGFPTYRDGHKREACLSAAQGDYSVGLKCAGETVCRLTAKNAAGGLNIGECVEENNVTAGNVCRKGVITSEAINTGFGDLYSLFAIRDQMNASATFNNAGGCTVPEQGVPLGRISKKCDRETDGGKLKIIDTFSDAAHKPKELCVIQGGDVFDECAVSSNPPQCLVEKAPTVARAYLDTCSASDPCREDYICQQLPVEVSLQYKDATREKTRSLVANRLKKLQAMGVGFCVPNYFVFNMRADGHILPEGRQELIGKPK